MDMEKVANDPCTIQYSKSDKIQDIEIWMMVMSIINHAILGKNT